MLNHVPINLAPVAVICSFVSLARSELKRASDFLIKQDVAHRLQDARINPSENSPHYNERRKHKNQNLNCCP
jgi:hypothetical protein